MRFKPNSRNCPLVVSPPWRALGSIPAPIERTSYLASYSLFLGINAIFLVIPPEANEMHPSCRLLQHACRITLFTRANCSLCTKAKQTLSAVWDVRPFIYREIDVMTPEEKSWRDLYEFDTPVVRQFEGRVAEFQLLTIMSNTDPC